MSIVSDSSRPPGLVVSFCNQGLSPECSVCFMDATNGQIRWLDMSIWPESFRETLGGVCGLAISGERLLLVTQSDTPHLILWNYRESRLLCFVPLLACRDPHSLVWHSSYVYVVSTGTNEIHRVSLTDDALGEEESFWAYPGTSPDYDQVHLNGLAIDAEGRLIASCFGEKSTEGRWGSAGRVFYVESGKTIHDGLNQPHSPVIVGEELSFAESKMGRVFIYERSESSGWRFKQSIETGGYPRGITFDGEELFIGISAERKVSRSQKTELTTNVGVSSSALLKINRETGNKEYVSHVPLYGNEIYDICFLGVTVSTDAMASALLVRIGNMESVFNGYVMEHQKLVAEYQEVVGFSYSSLQAEYRNLSDEYAKVLSLCEELRERSDIFHRIHARFRSLLMRLNEKLFSILRK